MLAHLKITRNHNKYLKVWRGERTQLLSWTETKMFDKSEFYRLRQMEEGFIGKWRRIPGSGRAEDVCWDRQGHRRVVCTSFTILYNAQASHLHNPKQCTSTQSATTHLHNAQLHNPTMIWKSTYSAQFIAFTQDSTETRLFWCTCNPTPGWTTSDYYSNPLIHVAHVAYSVH